MIDRIKELKDKIFACSFGDMMIFNGLDNPGTPCYTQAEQNSLEQEKMRLELDLQYLESGISLN